MAPKVLVLQPDACSDPTVPMKALMQSAQQLGHHLPTAPPTTSRVPRKGEGQAWKCPSPGRGLQPPGPSHSQPPPSPGPPGQGLPGQEAAPSSGPTSAPPGAPAACACGGGERTGTPSESPEDIPQRQRTRPSPRALRLPRGEHATKGQLPLETGPPKESERAFLGPRPLPTLLGLLTHPRSFSCRPRSRSATRDSFSASRASQRHRRSLPARNSSSCSFLWASSSCCRTCHFFSRTLFSLPWGREERERDRERRERQPMARDAKSGGKSRPPHLPISGKAKRTKKGSRWATGGGGSIRLSRQPFGREPPEAV